MDPCDTLKEDLEFEKEVLADIQNEALIRFILGVLGFEWLYDIIKGAKLDWTALLDALVILDIAYIVKVFADLLAEHGFKDAAKQLLKKIGPWAILILVAAFTVSLVEFLQRRSEAQREFDERLRELYDDSDCETKDDVFRSCDLPVPG